MMKPLIVLLLLSIPAAAQTWLPLGGNKARDGYRYSYRAGTLKETRDGYSFWMRAVPNTPQRKLGYVLMYVTVDCGDKRWSWEASTAYDRRGRVVQSQRYGESSVPVAPDTMREEIWESFCFKSP